MKSQKKKAVIFIIVLLGAVFFGIHYNKHRFTTEKWLSAQENERAEIIDDLLFRLKIKKYKNGGITRGEIHNMLGQPMEESSVNEVNHDLEESYYVGYMGFMPIDPYTLEIEYRDGKVTFWYLFER